MSSPAKPATPSLLSTALSVLGKQIAADVEGDGAQLLRGFFTNLNAAPNWNNLVAQGLILQTSAVLQGPVLENEVIGQFAQDGLATLNTIAPPTPVPAPAA